MSQRARQKCFQKRILLKWEIVIVPPVVYGGCFDYSALDGKIRGFL